MEFLSCIFSFRKFLFDSKSNFVEESLRRYRNFWPGSWSQFDTKSNFVEESLRRNRIFILHFSFRKFQFDSKSKFVGESLRRYRNFWPGSQSQFDTKSNFVGESLRRNRLLWPAFFNQKVSIWFNGYRKSFFISNFLFSQSFHLPVSSMLLDVAVSSSFSVWLSAAMLDVAVSSSFWVWLSAAMLDVAISSSFWAWLSFLTAEKIRIARYFFGIRCFFHRKVKKLRIEM